MANVYAKWELLAAAADKIRMETYVMRVAKDGFAGYVANTSQEFEGIAGVMDDSVLSAAWHKRGPTLPLFYCHGDELSVSSMSEEDSDATETEDSSPPPDFSNLHQSSVISSASTFIGLGQSSVSSWASCSEEGNTILDDTDDDNNLSAKFDCMFSGNTCSESPSQSPARKKRRRK
jgi:hypothetical protein